MSVVFKVHKKGSGPGVAQATLDAPKTLNSVSLEMIQSLHIRLKEWESDPQIAAVLIDASGEKAFCAGGDIVRLYQGMKERDSYPEVFFEKEYRLDYLIHTFKKPILIWGHGIVMGGGLGIMQGGTLRIATEKTMMAMPEITIGLYPDVGASYFLRNCPSNSGFYLAITGTRVNGAEALWLDLADHFIAHEHKEAFCEKLFQATFHGNFEKDKTLLQKIAEDFSAKSLASLPENTIEKEIAFVEEIASCQSPQELDKKMKSFATLNTWAQRGVDSFRKGSPSSLGIIFEQFRRGKTLSLKEAFQMEWNISVQCSRHPDFREGVRALLIDKDNDPKWTPKSIPELSSEWISEHFELPEGYEQSPLEDL